MLGRRIFPQPSIENVVHIVRKCTKEKNLAHALRLHAYMCRSGLQAHTSLGNYLVSMLVEVGSMGTAQTTFGRLVSRSAHAWNSLINGYIKCGESRRALILYQKMQEDSLHPSGHTFVTLLKACAKLKDVERGCEIHNEISRKGLLKTDLFIGSTLVEMYAKCGSLAKAQQVFDILPVRNVFTWNALIAGYVQHELGKEALKTFEQMQLEGVCPDAVTYTCSLKACSSIKAIDKGSELHAEIARKGLLKTDLFVGSALVDMYAACGLLAKAQEVFDMLPVRDVVTWNALIAGYLQHKHGEEALNCFEQMQLEGVCPNAVTFACSLKACGSIGAIDRGSEIHSEIAKKGLLKTDLFVANMLVEMYAKCGMLAKAQEVFEMLPVRNVVTWTTLIAGYAQHKRGEEALNCLDQMQLEGVSPDAVTLVCSLKACGSIGGLDKGSKIHAEVAKRGLLKTDLFVGSAVVDMYVKCGSLVKAQEVFDILPVRDAVTWNALIAGYVQHERGNEALNCFEQMRFEGVPPDAVTFACILEACGSMRAMDKGNQIHTEIARKGLLKTDLFLGSALVDMYAKCGSLAKAQEVFDMLPVHDVVTWNALISGYVQHERGEEALNCFELMQLKGVSPDAVTFSCSLKACGCIGATDKGSEIHAEIARKGLLKTDLSVGSALVDMYAKFGSLAKVQEVFDMLPVQNVVIWNALIAAYVQHECCEEALNCFEQMQLDGVSPDGVTFACSLKACGSIGATEKGTDIHAEISRMGLLSTDFFVGIALVDMYAKCGMLAKAQEVFDMLPVRNAVTWTALITGYVQHEHGEEALNCFKQMQLEGVSPDAVTFACSLKACDSIGAIDKGIEIHTEIATKGLLKTNLFVGNMLVEMYAKCGMLARAQEVFDMLPVRNVVTWTALVEGYAQHECGEEALDCIGQMHLEGLSPNALTFACSLKACGSIGAIDKGSEIHAEIARMGLLKEDVFVGSALVDMYAKCGSLAKAQEVFDMLPVQNIVTWNALITGYAQLGEIENVLFLFDRMNGEGIRPDRVTFVGILNACSHAGVLDEGQTYFEAMSKDYDITPSLKHHTCMIDLLGRAGQLDRAVEMMKKTPFHPDIVMWLAVLGACRKWGNVELGSQVFKQAVRLDEKETAAYVCMYNIYADADMQEDAKKVEAIRMEKQAWEKSAKSLWTDTGGNVHLFSNGD